MIAWTRHIQGASSLVQLRGKQQLRHRAGHELFIQLRTQVVSFFKSPCQTLLTSESLPTVFNDIYRFPRQSLIGPEMPCNMSPMRKLL
jgi:hypothetical protein